MADHNGANSVCTRIHDFIQASGLHFIINQTPWSSYITIRKKFVSPGAEVSNPYNDETKSLNDEIISLKKKVENLELELASIEQNNKESTEKLDLKVKSLEDEALVLEKEKKVKDEIIKNLNVGFREKVNDLNAKIDSLEAGNKELLKKEKKTIKKHRKKTEKAAIKGIEPYDSNENLLENAAVKDDSVREVVQSKGMESSLLHHTISSTVSRSPVRVSQIPSTPPTPYTPQGLPPVQTREQPIKTLSAYFADPASDVIEDTFDTEHVDMKEYVDNISKLSLIPLMLRRKEATDSDDNSFINVND